MKNIKWSTVFCLVPAACLALAGCTSNATGILLQFADLAPNTMLQVQLRNSAGHIIARCHTQDAVPSSAFPLRLNSETCSEPGQSFQLADVRCVEVRTTDDPPLVARTPVQAPGSPLQVKLKPLVRPTFSYSSLSTGGKLPQTLTVADVNGDGAPDLVVVDSAMSITSNVFVFINNGGTGFLAAPTQQFVAGTTPYSVVVADFDGDKINDIAVGTKQVGMNSLFLSKGQRVGGNGHNLTFPPATAVGFPGNLPSYVASIDTGTSRTLVAVNNDMGPPLAEGVFLFQNLQFATPIKSFTSPFGTFSNNFAFASLFAVDVNGNQKPDLVMTTPNQAASPLVTVILDPLDGASDLKTIPNPNNLSAQSIALADLNGDGKIDLVVPINQTMAGADSNEVEIFWGQGDGTFASAPQVINLTVSSRRLLRAAAVADFDGDQLPDAATLSYGTSMINFILHPAKNPSLLPDQSARASSPYSIATADFNQDCQPDLVIAYETDEPQVWLNTSYNPN